MSRNSRASVTYNHGHTGYSCYKVTTNMSYADAKKLVDQGKTITKMSDWIIALSTFGKQGWVAGLSFVYGENAKAQMQPFQNAVNQGKGVEYSYIAHFSSVTTYNYSTNFTFTAK